jgi:hypothetical protein
MSAEVLLYSAYIGDSDSGMTYIPATGQYLLTYWRYVSGISQTFVIGLKGRLVNLPEARVSTNANGFNQDGPDIACDPSRDRCLVVGKAWRDGYPGGTWARFITASTGVPSGNLFYLDYTTGRKEDQRVAFSPVSSRFVVTWVRSRSMIVAKRVYADLTSDAAYYTLISGLYGQQALSYNEGTDSFVATFKDGNTVAQNFALELNGNGDLSGSPRLQLSAIGTTGDGYPMMIANARDNQFLAMHAVNWRTIYTGLVAATNPGGGGGGGGGDPPNPAMSLDAPLDNSYVGATFTVSGWAIDRGAATGTGVSAVQIWAYPNPGSGQPAVLLGTAAYGGARTDVGTAYGAQFTNSGFTLTATLAPGRYQIMAAALSTVSGTFNQNDTAIVGVSQALLGLDSPAQDATVTNFFTVGGWAADPGAASGTGVDVVAVFAYPNPGSGLPAQLLAVAPYGNPRPDVATALGDPRFTNTGFSVSVGNLTPGPYLLVVFAHSYASGEWFPITKNITAGRGRVIKIDTPVDFASVASGFPITGWAANLAATAGTGVDVVQVWAYPTTGAAPIFLGTPTYGMDRPDVSAAFGAQFRYSGYSLVTNPLPSGSYVVAVFARTPASGAYENAKTVSVTVP